MADSLYLWEVGTSEYWEILAAFADEEYILCGRPEAEDEAHDHRDDSGNEWIAPLVVFDG